MFAGKVFATAPRDASHPSARPSLAPLNRRFKGTTRGGGLRFRVRIIRDGEQVKTGVYDTFVFHGPGEQRSFVRCHRRLCARVCRPLRPSLPPPPSSSEHAGRVACNHRAPPTGSLGRAIHTPGPGIRERSLAGTGIRARALSRILRSRGPAAGLLASAE